MNIKKLELQGFKSFPERTRVVFHPGITAIVGPNGTGKSNLVDAIVWVLGGQRQKGLRGEKTEHIIFNGNTKKPPLSMAEVSLFFEHDGEEISITHRVFRSGESEYRLNGKAARLKDIQDALWKRAVGEKDYFVIEQGSIGLLLTAKASEKRLFLEEAAGTAFYKDKKKEAQSKLALSEQNIVRLEDIISEVGRAKNSLQRQAQAAVRYRKLREKIRQLTALNLRRKLDELERRHEQALRNHAESLLEEKTLAARIREEEQKLAEKRKLTWELEKKIKESQTLVYSLDSQLQRTEAEREREARRSELAEEKIKEAGAAAAEFEEEMRSLEEAITESQRNLAQLEKEHQEKSEEMARFESSAISQEGQAALLENSIQALKEEHLLKLSALTELRNEALEEGKELDLLARLETKLASRRNEEEALCRAREKALAELEKNSEETAEQRKRVEEKLATLEEKLGAKRKLASELRSHLDDLKRTSEEARIKLEALRRIEACSRTSDPGDDLPESFGRLADLIEADSETATLIDSLWKEEITAPVIPALDFLKKAQEKALAGRFLLVQATKEESAPPLPEHPDVLGTLKSRLQLRPEIQPYVGQLEEALIVRDLQTAIELWLRYPSLNYLTPSGDVLYSSGLLKVGKKEEGLFSLIGEIRRFEEKMRHTEMDSAPLQAELEQTLAQVRGLEEELRVETDRRNEHSNRLLTLEKRRVALATELQQISSARDLLERELEATRLDRETLFRKREAKLERIRQLEEEEQSLKARIETAEKALLVEKGGKAEEEKRGIELRAEAELIQERLRHVSLKVGELLERRESLRRKLIASRQEAEAVRAALAESQEAQRLLEVKAARLGQEKRSGQASLDQEKAELDRLRMEEEQAERKLAELRNTLEKKKEERVRFEVAKAEVERDLLNLEETCWQELKKTLDEIKKEPPTAELQEVNVEEELMRAEEELQKFKAVNLMAEEEYLRHKERYDFLVQQRNDVRESIDATLEAIRQIDEESKNQFMTALAEVNAHFQEVFALLFKGGMAGVRLVDESNPLESGVEIIAQPPGKKVQNIALLSGGEKSLAGLAFLFALFRFKPTPFCVLDEVDAALDDANLARFLELMRNLKKSTQFIIVTHNYKTMEVADYIYGTTMAEPNITRLYSVKLEKQQELIP